MADGITLANGRAMDNGVTYTLNFLNNSSLDGTFCCFQQVPGDNNPDIFPLAWYTKFCNTGTSAKFQWTIDYSFVWSETGPLSPGVIFDATQTRPANLSTLNEITLDYDKGYRFTDQGPLGVDGSMKINETHNVPVGKASVGIGMSGTGTFVTQAGPNLSAFFTPHPQYWVTFGTFETGQVLDIEVLAQIAQVSYGEGVYSMTAILQEDNTWSITPTSAAPAWKLRRSSRRLSPQRTS